MVILEFYDLSRMCWTWIFQDPPGAVCWCPQEVVTLQREDLPLIPLPPLFGPSNLLRGH